MWTTTAAAAVATATATAAAAAAWTSTRGQVGGVSFLNGRHLARLEQQHVRLSYREQPLPHEKLLPPIMPRPPPRRFVASVAEFRVPQGASADHVDVAWLAARRRLPVDRAIGDQHRLAVLIVAS